VGIVPRRGARDYNNDLGRIADHHLKLIYDQRNCDLSVVFSTAFRLRACSKSRHAGLQMAFFCVPVLMYVKYIALRYSKITIFATACRFLIQALTASKVSNRICVDWTGFIAQWLLISPVRPCLKLQRRHPMRKVET